MNRRHVLAHPEAMQETFTEIIDPVTYAKSVQCTLAKSRFGLFEDTYHTAILLSVLFSGVLPWTFGAFTGWLGTSAWTMAVFLFAVVVGQAFGQEEQQPVRDTDASAEEPLDRC